MKSKLEIKKYWNQAFEMENLGSNDQRAKLSFTFRDHILHISQDLIFYHLNIAHIGKHSGHNTGGFRPTFSKKNFLPYCDVTTDDN